MTYRNERYATSNLSGEVSQQMVADFFEKKLGEPAINKSRCGHDVICGEHKIEVKSISSIFRSCKPKNHPRSKKQMNVFLLERKYIKEDTTLFSFVIKDDILFPVEKILTIEAETMFKFIKRSRGVKQVVIPLWWVVENYSYKYSKTE